VSAHVLYLEQNIAQSVDASKCALACASCALLVLDEICLVPPNRPHRMNDHLIRQAEQGEGRGHGSRWFLLHIAPALGFAQKQWRRRRPMLSANDRVKNYSRSDNCDNVYSPVCASCVSAPNEVFVFEWRRRPTERQFPCSCHIERAGKSGKQKDGRPTEFLASTLRFMLRTYVCGQGCTDEDTIVYDMTAKYLHAASKELVEDGGFEDDSSASAASSSSSEESHHVRTMACI
jgi:hypothetical protein